MPDITDYELANCFTHESNKVEDTELLKEEGNVLHEYWKQNVMPFGKQDSFFANVKTFKLEKS